MMLTNYDNLVPSEIIDGLDLPAHWKKIRFRHLFSFDRGLGITKANLKDEGIPCVNYGEIHSKLGFEVIPERDQLKFVDEEYLETSEKALLNRGDFVFADTSEDLEGSGNFTYLNSDETTFAGYHTVIARLKSKDDPRYLAYLFDSIVFRTQVRQRVTGVKVFSITQLILKSCFVWLPPYDEQSFIVKYLDHKLQNLDRLIDKKKEVIEKLSEELKALINQATMKGIDGNVEYINSEIDWLGDIPKGWDVMRLKFCVQLINLKVEGQSTSLNYLGMENVASNTGDMIYDQENPSICEGVGNKFDKNDILFGKLRPYLAKVLKAETEGFCSTELLVLRSTELLTSEYLHFLLLSDSFINLVNSSTYGSKMPRASWDFIGNISIPVPRIEVQKQITTFIKKEKCRLQKAIMSNRIAVDKLLEYRASLINSAVSGSIRVCDKQAIIG